MSLSAQGQRYLKTGVSPSIAEELASYDAVAFQPLPPDGPLEVPLVDEPFAACWQGWLAEIDGGDVVAVLARYLPQLRFPIRSGVSGEEGYRAATLRGDSPSPSSGATGLELERSDEVELDLYASIAGHVPVFTVRHRPDFVTLVRALARRNEPVPIPDAQGAAMVAGLANWERIRQRRAAWEALDPEERATSNWNQEFARIRRSPALYQDRFVLLSDGPYSGVPASDLELEDEEWRELSLRIRREHECCHYFTRRALGAMRLHAVDELIADHAGLTAARGRFLASWFLRFLGLEGSEGVRPGGRLEIYRGDPALSDEAFDALAVLVRSAARNVETFDRARWPGEERRSLEDRTLAVYVLAASDLAELASEEAPEILGQRAEDLARRVRRRA